MKAIELKPTNLYAVEVPLIYTDIYFNEFGRQYFADINHDGLEEWEERPIPLPFNRDYSYIGYVTKDKEYLFKEYGPSYNIPIDKLLKDNGLLFTNILGSTKPGNSYNEGFDKKISDAINEECLHEWELMENDLVKGKLLIFIKK